MYELWNKCGLRDKAKGGVRELGNVFGFLVSAIVFLYFK